MRNNRLAGVSSRDTFHAFKAHDAAARYEHAVKREEARAGLEHGGLYTLHGEQVQVKVTLDGVARWWVAPFGYGFGGVVVQIRNRRRALRQTEFAQLKVLAK